MTMAEKPAFDDAIPITAVQRHAPTGARAFFTRLGEPQILFPCIAVFVLAMIWATTFGVIRAKDAAATHAAAESTSVFLSAYEAQVVRNLREIDLTLNLVRFWHQRARGHALSELNENGLLPPDLLFTVSIADVNGTIVDSTRPEVPQNVADQDIFRKQRDSGTLIIGPVPRGPTGDAKMPFSRRLNTSNGAFDGIVIVSVDAAYFVSGYDSSKLGEHGVLSLIGTDGVSQVTRTGDELISGERIDYAASVQDPDVTETDTAVSISSWDGTRRWMSARNLYGFPLAVLVGLSVDEQMAAPQRQTRAYLAWAALASALVVVLTAFLGRMSWQLAQGREMFRRMAESTKAIPFTLDLTRGYFTYIGAQGIAESGISEVEWKKPGGLDIALPRETNPEIRQRFDECEIGQFEFETPLSQRNGQRTEARWTGTCEIVKGAKYLRGLMLDVTELSRLGRELAAAQKLESVGRLAGGVAHEINTPVQFVSDNVQFIRTSLTDIAAVIEAYRGLQHAVESSGDVASAARLASEAAEAADLDFIMEKAPPALDSSLEGLGRIATIVRSLKEFAHPDQSGKTMADLNQAIKSTLVIAHSEYKYVAEVETDFGELPPVSCYLGEINQVVLNLLVNAAHAISDVVKGSGAMGKLTVRTRLDGNEVEIAIGDSGTGIPQAARERIFDPFFTTKAVGKGTGQGLALAHSVIVKKHQGTLSFETECGKGTTFFIRIPVGESSADRGVEQVAA
ncbi:MAG: ATP-binding protein [Pseudomonadota bacterium]